MARGRSVVVVNQVAFVLAYFAAGPSAAIAQLGFDRPGIRLGLPGIDIAGVLATSPASVNLGGHGLNVVLPAAVAPGLITTTQTAVSLHRGGASASVSGASVAGLITTTPTSASLTRSGLNATVAGVSVAGLIATTPTSINLSANGLNASLPGVNLAGLIATTPASVGLNKDGAAIGLPGVDVAGTTVATGTTLSAPVTPGSGQGPLALSASDLINHASSVAQLFAGMGTAQVFAPVEQLLNSLAFGNDAPPGCASADANSLGPAPSADIWTWNAATVGRKHHDGYRVADDDGNACSSPLPFQTLERTQLPGVLWDASSAFGFKKGTLHMGLSGGAVESDTQIKSSAVLRDAGLSHAGTARLRSWSVGGFSLLTMDKWYAGSAVGGTWGRTESQNFIVGSDSDYETSAVVAAGFLGTIVPLTDTVRLDVRGTLAYQRTVGDGHIDSLGIVHGDHTIEAADAMLSGRLFGVFRHDGMIIRPFIQAGVTHHLSYSNALELGGVAFTLHEADTTVFAATGLDLEIDRTLQLSVGVRHDASADTDSVTGRFGLSLRLN